MSQADSAPARPEGAFKGPEGGSAKIRAMATRGTSFGKDTGLQARMLLTLFLLGGIYVVFVGVLFAAGASAAVIVVVAG